MEHRAMSKISDSKLKAFSIGLMGKKALSKKEQEEQRKKEDEKAAAQVFTEFVEAFNDDTSKASKKVWVKAGVYDAGKRSEDTRDRGKLYKPTSRLSEMIEEKSIAERNQMQQEAAKESKRPDKPGKKKEEKKKTNLEIFKEELRMIQEEREERHRLKGMLPKDHSKLSSDPNSKSASSSSASLGLGLDLLDDSFKFGSHDTGDPLTTNLYLGNLSPQITEQELMELFGKYGPLASVKIMWPRTDEEKSRGRNCGFVAYMSRKDGERALRAVNGIDVMGFEMRLGWGKAVPIPPYPIYIPPKMAELTLPPPPSGLPFNAQPSLRDKGKVPPPGTPYPTEGRPLDEFHRILGQAIVKVVIPTERNLLSLIHRVVEFVLREGPLFEAMIMNKEINNPMYRFLFENQTPAHVYYRWKLFSMLQGDSPGKWRLQEFIMFKDGSVWRPPAVNPFLQGMPDEMVDEDEKEKDSRRGTLSNNQREHLECLLRHISPQREKIAEAMVWCVEHSDASDEVCQCIVESISSLSTPLHKKVGRLYLVADILLNYNSRSLNASSFRKGFYIKLEEIFNHIRDYHKSIEDEEKSDAFKQRVMQCVQAWQDADIFHPDFLIQLQNSFLGLQPVVKTELNMLNELANDPEEEEGRSGMNGGTQLHSGNFNGIQTEQQQMDDDLDGVPLNDDDEDIDGQPMDESVALGQQKGFKVSKWETVDPQTVQSQAITISKWDKIGEDSNSDDNDNYDSKGSSLFTGNNTNDGIEQDDDEQPYENREMTEKRRAKLREIEMKVMQYQDELESGRRTTKDGWSVTDQVRHQRRKLLRKAERQEKDEEREKEEEEEQMRRKKERKRSNSSSDEGEQRRRRRRSSTPPPSSYKKRRERSRSRSRSLPRRSTSYRQRSDSPPSGRRRDGGGRSPSLSPSPPSSSSRMKHKKRRRR